MAKKNHPFKGALAKPIRIKLPARPARKEYETEEEFEQAQISYEKDFLNAPAPVLSKVISKLPLLFEHYGLANDYSEGSWKRLAVNLAKDCVPGFRVEVCKSIGRKEAWNPGIQAVLYFSVKKIILESESSARKKNVTDACKILAKKDCWKNLGIRNAKTLKNRYAESKDSPMVKHFESLRQRNHGEGREFDLVYCDIVTDTFSLK